MLARLARGRRHGLRRARDARRRDAGPSARHARSSTASSTRGSAVPIPADAGDFRLLDRRVVDALKSAARAQPLHEGPVRLGRLPHRRPSTTTPDERFAGDAATFSLRGLCAPRDRPASPRSRTLPLRLWSALGAVDRARARSALGAWFVDRALRRTAPTCPAGRRWRWHDVLQRRAAAVDRHPRRVRRPHLRRGQAAPGLPRPPRQRAERRGRGAHRRERAARSASSASAPTTSAWSTASPRRSSRSRPQARLSAASCVTNAPAWRERRGSAGPIERAARRSACTSTSPKAQPLQRARSRARWPTLPGAGRAARAGAPARACRWRRSRAEFARPASTPSRLRSAGSRRSSTATSTFTRLPGVRDVVLDAVEHVRPSCRPCAAPAAPARAGLRLSSAWVIEAHRRARARSARSIAREHGATTASCSAPTTSPTVDYRRLMQAWLAGSAAPKAACSSAILCRARRATPPIRSPRRAGARPPTSPSARSSPTSPSAGVTVAATWPPRSSSVD